MKVIVKRIPCRKKPAPDAAEQAKADACNANVVCIPIDMKRMLRNAKLSKGIWREEKTCLHLLSYFLRQSAFLLA